MQPSDFLLPLATQQEQFSYAYIGAIAAAAGYATYSAGPDFDCVDLEIKQRGTAAICPKRHVLNVQAKCTYAHVPDGNCLNYPLDVRAYNIMRNDATLDPHILVVVHVPDDATRWITHDTEYMLMHHRAYWYNLRGMGDTNNSTTVTIAIPTSNCFTVEWLRTAMNKIATAGLL
jgi:hypothetical protein